MICILIQIEALIFQVLYLLIIFMFDLHQLLELILVKLKLLLKTYDSNILCQFSVLLFRLLLEMLQLSLYFVHMGLVGVYEIIFVLTQHLHKLLVIGSKHLIHLVVCVLHVSYILLHSIENGVHAHATVSECSCQLKDEIGQIERLN